MGKLQVNDIKQFCTFRLEGRLFGVDIMTVQEVNQETAITPIYHSPQAVKGYINVRGQIYLVVDLRMLFGFDPKEIDKKNRVVIFKNSVAQPFGVLVDSIEDIVMVETNSIVERRQNTNKKSNSEDENKVVRKSHQALTLGVSKLDNDLMVVLNAFGILESVAIHDKNLEMETEKEES